MITLPEYVRKCACCDGAGRTSQTYTAGCGGGYYSSYGPCEHCGKNSSYGEAGPGYVYKATGAPVGKSVLAQIQSMNVTEEVNG